MVTLKFFHNAKYSLSLWSKLAIGHGKWFLNTMQFVPYQTVPYHQVWMYYHKIDFRFFLKSSLHWFSLNQFIKPCEDLAPPTEAWGRRFRLKRGLLLLLLFPVLATGFPEAQAKVEARDLKRIKINCRINVEYDIENEEG